MHVQLIRYLAVFLFVVLGAGAAAADERFTWMKGLEGDWKLSAADVQEGGATRHKLVAPHVGSGRTAMSFRVIGNGSTIQESLLPGTGKEMATMYHCDGFASCGSVVATHYCTKRNQPQFVVAEQTDPDRMVFECDASSALCQSDANHIHRIAHQLSNEGAHLKVTYTTWVDGGQKKNSIYHFDRK
jgi:hypothetical protein